MKQRRIFIAINPPENFKKITEKIQNEFAELPMRWIKPKNIHLTLSFIGYANDEDILNICKSLAEELTNEEMFIIKFNSVKLGPNENSPRLIWMEGEENEKLSKLKTKIEKAVLKSNSNYKAEYKKFKPHITIGRIKQREWDENFKKMKINKKINLEFWSGSVEVMESSLQKTGAEYITLESFELK